MSGLVTRAGKARSEFCMLVLRKSRYRTFQIITIVSRSAAVLPRRPPLQNHGSPPRSPSSKTPHASWRSYNPSGGHSRLQKPALHGSVAPCGPSVLAAVRLRPEYVRAHQAAPAQTQSSSTIWTCARQRQWHDAQRP